MVRHGGIAYVPILVEKEQHYRGALNRGVRQEWGVVDLSRLASGTFRSSVNKPRLREKSDGGILGVSGSGSSGG